LKKYSVTQAYSIDFGFDNLLTTEYLIFNIILLRTLRISYKYPIDGVDLQIGSTYHVIILRIFTRVMTV